MIFVQRLFPDTKNIYHHCCTVYIDTFNNIQMLKRKRQIQSAFYNRYKIKQKKKLRVNK